MVSPDVKTYVKTSRHPAAAATKAVGAATLLGAGLAAIAPTLAGHVPPHPTLTGSLGDAGEILANNARVLAAPFVAIVLGFHETGYGRRLGDTVAALVVAASAVPVGVALDHWGARLLPYIPQLPIEFAALATAVSAWLAVRCSAVDRSDVARRAVTTIALLIAAASVETFCTPQRSTRSTASRPNGDNMPEPNLLSGDRVVACAADSCAGQAQSLQGRALPSPHSRSVPLGLHAGADRATSTTRPPGGIT